MVDGDGYIFQSTLLEKGQDGGRAAAKMITDALREHLQGRQVEFLVSVFYNKSGLMSALSTGGMPEARAGFDNFVTGFNQASKRYLMVDVGYGKEVADAKLRGVPHFIASYFIPIGVTYDCFLLFSYFGK